MSDMWGDWSRALLRSDAKVLAEVMAFLEKRWRNGRTPQPRGRDGRWIKHTSHISVGVGRGSGSGRGTGFATKMRPGDNIHRGPIRLGWSTPPGTANPTVIADNPKVQGSTYTIQRRDTEGRGPVFTAVNSSNGRTTDLGAFTSLGDAQRAASTHANTHQEPPAAAPKLAFASDGSDRSVATGPDGTKYTVTRTYNNKYILNSRKSGESYGERVGRFSSEAEAQKAAQDRAEAIAAGRTPEKYLEFNSSQYGGWYAQSATGNNTYTVKRDANGKYVLKLKEGRGRPRQVGKFDTLEQAQAAAHEQHNGRGAVAGAVPVAELPVLPAAEDGKPMTWQKDPSGAYIGSGGYSVVKEGSKWNIYHNDGTRLKKVGSAGTLKAAKAQSERNREFAKSGKAGLQDLATMSAADRRAAMQKILGGTFGNKGYTLDFTSTTGSGFSANIVDRDGKPIGSITRQWYRSRHGLEVHHDWMAFNDYALMSNRAYESPYSGTGFATDVNARLYEWYRDSGVDAVTVHAALTVGGYTWARQGFDFDRTNSANRYAWRTMSDRITTLQQSARGEDRERLAELQRRLDAGDPPAAYDIASFKARDPETIKILQQQADAAAENLRETLRRQAAAAPTAERREQLNKMADKVKPRFRDLGRHIMEGTSWHGIRKP